MMMTLLIQVMNQQNYEQTMNQIIYVCLNYVEKCFVKYYLIYYSYSIYFLQMKVSLIIIQNFPISMMISQITHHNLIFTIMMNSYSNMIKKLSLVSNLHNFTQQLSVIVLSQYYQQKYLIQSHFYDLISSHLENINYLDMILVYHEFFYEFFLFSLKISQYPQLNLYFHLFIARLFSLSLMLR